MTGTPNEEDHRMAAGKEITPQDKRNADRLRRYWTKGQGAIRIAWGTEGDWTRCVTNLSPHLKDAKGYCADLHHEVLGYWPGDKRNQSDGKKRR